MGCRVSSRRIGDGSIVVSPIDPAIIESLNDLEPVVDLTTLHLTKQVAQDSDLMPIADSILNHHIRGSLELLRHLRRCLNSADARLTAFDKDLTTAVASTSSDGKKKKNKKNRSKKKNSKINEEPSKEERLRANLWKILKKFKRACLDGEGQEGPQHLQNLPLPASKDVIDKLTHRKLESDDKLSFTKRWRTVCCVLCKVALPTMLIGFVAIAIVFFVPLGTAGATIGWVALHKLETWIDAWWAKREKAYGTEKDVVEIMLKLLASFPNNADEITGLSSEIDKCLKDKCLDSILKDMESSLNGGVENETTIRAHKEIEETKDLIDKLDKKIISLISEKRNEAKELLTIIMEWIIQIKVMSVVAHMWHSSSLWSLQWETNLLWLSGLHHDGSYLM